MTELWLKNKKLVPEKEWVLTIEDLQSKERIKDKKIAKKQLRKLFVEAVERRLPPGRFGGFFSGGVDSGLIASICKFLKRDFVCYAVGFQDSETKEPEDITEAKKVAKVLGLKLKFKIYTLKEVEIIIKKVVEILKPVGKTDVVNVGVGAVVLAARELGKKEKVFLGGLGSEEIFAGYERHKVKDVNEECWQGLKKMWSRDLVRDFNLAKKSEIRVGTPFLDEELIKYAMQLPGKWKLSEVEKKIILREVAEEFLGEFAWRKKKAAQYGSCFDKAIGKLAKQKGFKLKKDYLGSL